MNIIPPGAYVTYLGLRHKVGAVLCNGGERAYMLVEPKYETVSIVPASLIEMPAQETSGGIKPIGELAESIERARREVDAWPDSVRLAHGLPPKNTPGKEVAPCTVCHGKRTVHGPAGADAYPCPLCAT